MFEEVYCRYEDKNSQRHLEGSRLNWAMRKESRMENKREKRGWGARGQEPARKTRAPKDHVAKRAVLCTDQRCWRA